MKNEKPRYFIFSRTAFAKNGQYKSIKNMDTRDKARAQLKMLSNKSLAIFDRVKNCIIR